MTPDPAPQEEPSEWAADPVLQEEPGEWAADPVPQEGPGELTPDPAPLPDDPEPVDMAMARAPAAAPAAPMADAMDEGGSGPPDAPEVADAPENPLAEALTAEGGGAERDWTATADEVPEIVALAENLAGHIGEAVLCVLPDLMCIGTVLAVAVVDDDELAVDLEWPDDNVLYAKRNPFPESTRLSVRANDLSVAGQTVEAAGGAWALYWGDAQRAWLAERLDQCAYAGRGGAWRKELLRDLRSGGLGDGS